MTPTKHKMLISASRTALMHVTTTLYKHNSSRSTAQYELRTPPNKFEIEILNGIRM
ncbi:hypothetical protein DAPPUDRAFT_262582 [Daphnia pulex]|uniref:Uncharacterized protein n=1 Tax=Daphnia pulex TaxID=6669 RepID=E9HN86_DAPPU|nr:hypothetical protein DAPPUDRAFT_262582 [Daphnia pulex]|eukprot:EFX66791.1 hypothetical protein DAPPUDRAFT_262582 [Daphnia pulex]